jgi:DNA-binding transcriptional regulator GbsR (MarR family)
MQRVYKAHCADTNATLAELARVTRLSKYVVRTYLRKLEAQGLITRNTKRGRRVGYYSDHPEAVKSYKRRQNNQGKNETIEDRINWIVQRDREGNASADLPQHDVVRHINRPLRIRGSRSFGS